MASVFGQRSASAIAPNRAVRPDWPGRRDPGLGDILSTSVIPRMLIAHSRPAATPESDTSVIRAEDVESLVPLTIGGQAHDLLEHVEGIMRRGVAAEQIFVDLLAPAARWLGQEWEEDRLDFLDVSMGLWRLQEVLREVSAETTHAQQGEGRRSALFTAMPGDDHSFGAAMVQECFSIAGWDADLMIDGSLQQLVESAAQRHLDVLGLTLSCDRPVDQIASVIRTVRSVSINRNLCVMIGGRLPAEQPNLVAQCGADGTALSASAAVTTANRLVGMMRMAVTA